MPGNESQQHMHRARTTTAKSLFPFPAFPYLRSRRVPSVCINKTSEQVLPMRFVPSP